MLGCNNHTNIIKETETVFFTQDSLYKISFVKPLELDTFYSWKSFDDYSCGDQFRYRFSKKPFPVTTESGWFQNPKPDSSYRITVSHNLHYQCKEKQDDLKYVAASLFLKRAYLKSLEKGCAVDTVFSINSQINKRNFIIYALREKCSTEKYYANHLTALTIADGNMISFKCDCLAKNCENFIENMKESMNTIKIEKFK